MQYIVYPASYFDEIKRLPDTQASAQDFFYKVTYGEYTHIGTETDAMWKTIGVDLARSVPAKVPAKQQDARIAFEKFVGYAPEWKAVNIFNAFMNIVATTNACSFVGREVGTAEWPQAVQRLPMAVYVAVLTLSWIPRVLRPIFKPLLFIPALRIQKGMRNILKPVIQKDMLDYESAPDKREILKVRDEAKLPFTAWLMSRYKPAEATEYQLATDYLVTAFESTVSTAVTLYNIVADLAVSPELQEELREELNEILTDGKLPATNLKELKKMDSVMRETFRMNPFALCTCMSVFNSQRYRSANALGYVVSLYRVTRQPIKLSKGPTIPAGTILCVDSHHINASPTLFPSPEKYDPHRFLKKRSLTGAENRHQFVSTGPEDPNWGDGNQACPGRFFANSTIKVCLTHVLMNYDLKMRDGEGRAKPTTMPNGSWAPDMNAHVLFKSRT